MIENKHRTRWRDVTGQRFGYLVAIEPTDDRVRHGIVWRCLCDCGNTKDAPSSRLLRGYVKSCGCKGDYSTSDVPDKRCCTCRKRRPLEDFSKNRSEKDGLSPRCRECKRKQASESNARHREAIRRRERERRRNNPETIRESARRWYKNNKELANRINRNNNLKRLYGITSDEYEEILEAQGYVCAICKSPPHREGKPNKQRLHVDHDHVTGKIRGLLCYHCNTGVGQFRDLPVLLRAAAEYLEAAP